ncbi:DALR domain-containing protein [Rhizobium sp. AN83]|uniref:CysS/YqeB C-terminal domain-containing protein n=1 Tax=Rhizobium sp. AN83 TaxID=3035217 RepID=UPI003A599104
MLMTHYREPIDFSVKRLEEVERLLAKWPAAEASDAAPDETVLDALADDLNTVAAVQALHALAHAANTDPARLPAFAASAALLGVLPKKAEVDEAIVSAVDALVQPRLEMLKAKNFAEADRLRDELSEKGIQLKDGKDKETGERTTTWELKR